MMMMMRQRDVRNSRSDVGVFGVAVRAGSSVLGVFKNMDVGLVVEVLYLLLCRAYGL